MTGYNIPPREYAEWANFWFEKGSDFETARVMLIGDSITNGYRKIVQELVRDKGIYVDMAVGSRCAGDPALTAEIEYALGPVNGYTYSVVHFNNCLHGGCNDTLIGIENYEKGLRRAIETIKRLQPKAKLIIATGTPMRGKENPHGSVEPTLNGFVLERNAIIRRLAEEYGLILDDLFEVVAGKEEYTQNDGVHFDEAGRNALAEAVKNAVLDAMK